jgi:Ca2+-binding RTX toxin-like protein
VRRADRLAGGAGADKISLGSGADHVWAATGNDTIEVSYDGMPDRIDCGAGEDLVILSGAEDPKDKYVDCEAFIIIAS